jgi:hypothetical protein
MDESARLGLSTRRQGKLVSRLLILFSGMSLLEDQGEWTKKLGSRLCCTQQHGRLTEF